MKTFAGIEGTTYIFHGSSDPEVIYKGISFNELDIEDAIQTENENIDIDEFLYNPNNHDSIREMLDGWIWAQQTSEKIMEMKAKTKENFDETNFRTYMIQDIIGWSKKSDENFQRLFDFIKTSAIKEDLSDISFFDDVYEAEYKLDYIEDKELLDFCSSNNISIDSPYVIYLQNDEYYDDYWNKEDFIEGIKKIVGKENNGLYAIVQNAEGVFHEGIIGEDFKSEVFKKLNIHIDRKPEKINKDNYCKG